MSVLISVIVPTYNRVNQLLDCLRCIAPGNQSLSAELYEVIVSDDGWKDENASLFRKEWPWVDYVEGPARGPAANRNNGAKYARGEWLVFTDDDCLPDKEWLNAYVQAIMNHPDCRALEGAILPDNKELLKRDLAECPVNELGGCFWSANIAIHRELFCDLKGFDEEFRIAAQEDQDLFLRVKELTRVCFIPEAVVSHPVRIALLGDKIRQIDKSMKNWIYYYRKHNFQPPLPRKFLLSALFYLKVSVKFIAKAYFRTAVLKISYSVVCITFYFKGIISKD